jgi:lysophospholipase L1-like esterase
MGMNTGSAKYTGRFDFSDPRGPWFAWSASMIGARFSGTGIKARLNSPGDNYFTVLLDDEIIINSLHVAGEKVFTLATAQKAGIHNISLFKRTEFNIGKAQFLGFEVENGILLEPAEALERRIEIVGDSISCGFGIEGDQTTAYDPKFDNSFASYGSLSARMLGAECFDISCSGYGVIREYTGDTNNIIPNVYSLILPGTKTEWDFKSWIPQVVVINLGTNDFSFGFIPDRSAFIDGYINLTRRIRGNYPDAQIICTIGPILDGEVLKVTRECLHNGVVDYLRKNGQDQVHFIEFEHHTEEDGYGIAFHPSIATHKKMADQLTREIKSIMNW